MNIVYLPQGATKMCSQWNMERVKKKKKIKIKIKGLLTLKSVWFRINQTGAKNGLDLRFLVFQVSIQAARLCKQLPVLLSTPTSTSSSLLCSCCR